MTRRTTPAPARPGRRLRLALARVALASALLPSIACVAAVGPDRADPPELRALEVRTLTSSPSHGGVLNLHAWPRDTTFRLPRGQSLPAELAVSSGDRETVRLQQRFCPVRERSSFLPCFEFTVHMREGHHISSVADRVAAIGGRFSLLAFTGSFGSVTLFHPEVIRQARQARSWPGVDGVVIYAPGCPIDAPCLFSLSQLQVPLPVDVGSAVPGDGVVQVRPGDVVTISYQQPSGGRLVTRMTVP